MRRIALIAAIVSAIMGAAPIASASERREDQEIVVHDARGRQRSAKLRWSLQLVTQTDGSLNAKGRALLRFENRGEQVAWHIVKAEPANAAAPDSARLRFLKLTMMPTRPGRGAEPIVATLRAIEETEPGDSKGRVKVKFFWDMPGVGTFDAKGEITIKGSKILMN